MCVFFSRRLTSTTPLNSIPLSPFSPPKTKKVIYYYHVPEIHVSHVLNSPGLGYSEKLMVYLLATQVAFHDGLGSFWGAALGVVAGGAYCSEPGGVLR